MASGTIGMALRHLRDLFGSGTTAGLTDGQLLARYAASQDGSAFEVLVARYGPMVLATCRAILRHEHDVEDAFQATFLVLARKASAIRTGDALGGWLHRVAYRVAVEANIAAKRRRLRESEVSARPMAMTIPDATHPRLDPDVPSILHEEIDRLPESQRLSVVLCDLEGLTYEQAAVRLHWTEPTLRHRLSKARRRLRDRLTRRGVTAEALGALMAAPSLPPMATAVVPVAWTRAAVAAATGAPTSAAVVALSQTILRSMLMTKLKIAATAAFVAAAMASVGVVAVGAGRPDQPKPEMKAPAPAQEKEPVVKPPPAARDNPAPAPGTTREVRGQVVGPDGKPVPGATVRTAYLTMDDRGNLEMTTGPDGRFHLRIPPPGPGMATLNGGPTFPWLVASAPGLGPGWITSVFKAAAAGEVTIRLVKDGPPIEGRIVDLEGRPVAGAQVKVDCLWYPYSERDRNPETGDLSAWIKVVNDRGVQGPWEGLEQLPTTFATTTGADGRFHLTGIGRERMAHLLVSGPTIATTVIYAMSRSGPEARCVNRRFMDTKALLVFHAHQFEQAVAPTKPIEGVIRDKETGRPIAGVKLRGAVYQEHSLLWDQGIEATSDAQGRYRLAGLPKAPAYRLFIEPGEGQPYPKATLKAPADSPAFEAVKFDIALKRGILVRGRVTDKATGQPVPGYVESLAFANNPHIGEFPGFRESYPPHVYLKPDGHYELVALPGRNIIGCRSDMRRYRGAVGAPAIKGYNAKSMSINTLPQYCHAGNYNVLVAVDLDTKTESADLDLQVDPGRTITATVVDPDGKPVSGTKAAGISDLFSSTEYPQDAPTFEIHGLDPSKPRRVIVSHSERKLLGSVYLKGNESGPLTIRLQPWGTITGRIIDDDGKPRGGLWLSSAGGSYPERPDVQGILPEGNHNAGIRIGSDGRFRVEGLVPGLQYGANASDQMSLYGELFHEVTVAPGEVKDLGDLKVIRPKRDGQP
jgi:RNA polymerase sigma factor (sigma-70 family)